MNISHRFVKNIPDKIENNILYISMDYNISIHLCPCGCGSEIATPLSPNDWKIIYDGKTVSLYPSIGNWSLPCKSHYWITKDNIVWDRKWSEKEIRAFRANKKSQNSRWRWRKLFRFTNKS
jgi:3'-phosphoadenosine 5'-phosphosulfate sulfotransferase (PAPS reductase)/FAD synthetase